MHKIIVRTTQNKIAIHVVGVDSVEVTHGKLYGPTT
jgi:hypothetical protein